MRSLRLPVKVGALALLFGVPLVIVAAIQAQRLSASVAVDKAELQGSRLVRELGELTRVVQRHRGQMNMVLAGNAAAQAQVQTTRTDMQSAVRKVDAAKTPLPDPALDAAWSAIQQKMQDLMAAAPASPTQAFAAHSRVVADLQRLTYAVGDRSSLLFDPEPDTYFLMDMVVSHAPQWAELIAQIRGAGAGEVARGATDVQAVARLQAMIGEAGHRSEGIGYLQGYAARYGHDALGAKEAVQAAQSFLAMAGQAVGGSTTLTAQAFFEAGTRALQAIVDFEQRTQERLEARLAERASHSEFLLQLTVVGASVGLLVMFYFVAAFYFSFVLDLQQAIEVTRQTAAGNLRSPVSVRGRDELAELSRLLQGMNASLSGMVAEVRSNSALVAYSGKSLASGNRNLAQRTEQQAANLEQTAASVQELTGTVQQNASTAGESDRQAASVRDVADAGARSMVEAVASVEQIQQSAQRMSDIIGVIDGLAFQTNILALNAAVEAARAGEQGRGFAVVAGEVRSLAQRSAAAAKEIRQLIESSTRQVELSTRQIRDVGRNIGQIVDGVRTVAGNMSLISAASAEQSTGLTEISLAVRQLDDITQRNAQMVERAVEQSDLLEHRAAHLARAVSGFQLQQGTAEEAMDLVQRAVDRRSGTGRDGFVQTLSDPASGFHDRDMYVFALDSAGTYRAFGGNPGKVGSRVQDIPGVDGDALLRSIIAQAEIEPGWVEYDIVNPASGKVQTKMSYVTRIDDLYLGCGVYKSAAMAAT
ncbi:MAG: methyl-accepting chemotaxis protein [Burkholderiaceae bacterium]